MSCTAVYVMNTGHTFCAHSLPLELVHGRDHVQRAIRRTRIRHARHCRQQVDIVKYETIKFMAVSTCFHIADIH